MIRRRGLWAMWRMRLGGTPRSTRPTSRGRIARTACSLRASPATITRRAAYSPVSSYRSAAGARAGLRRCNRVPDAHPDRWKVRKKAVYPAAQIPLDLSGQVAVRGRRFAGLQIVRQKFILGPKRPHMPLQPERVCALHRLEARQWLRDPDGIRGLRD